MKTAYYKKPSVSETIKTEVVCPNDTNPMGILQGGRLIQWMDIAAAVCAQTHAGKICVTASINQVDFDAEAKVGDIITICARITRAFKSSMEISVQAFSREVLKEKKHRISQAYFTFVALGEDGKAATVTAVLPVTSLEKKQFNAALYRRKRMLQLKKKRV